MPQSGVSTQPTSPAATASPPPGAPPIRVPALTPEKVNEYSGLFEKSGAENGSLPGVLAKQIFEKARLPNDVLGRIWMLSDTHGRGSLDRTEFVIAMHLLASFKAGVMRGVPSTLPPGLYEAANRQRPTSFPRPGSSSTFVPQSTGFVAARSQSPLTRAQAGTPLSQQSTGDGWVISPTDKMRFDQIFMTVDKQNRGFLTGDQAVEFFGNARLPEETLAQIWDLADINSEGQLNKDEFAVAMYLIRQQRATKDGRGILPSSLPPALVPPSMRRQPVAPQQPTAPAFENAQVTQPRSAADDLFGLDAFAASPTAIAGPAAPRQVPESTGGTDAGPFANPPSAVASQGTGSVFKPFMPLSSFGQSILPQSTGSPTLQESRGVGPQTSDDLLGDTDPAVSNRLTNETTELANLSNQVGNLSKQMNDVHASRGQADQELAQNSQQKRDFEARLGQLRTQYEQEVKDVKALQTQLTTSRNDTKRLQQDMAMIEGTHHDLRTQHQQLATALQTDQQENTSLKEKIRQVNAEVEQLRPQLDKLKSEARQQKGLVAINRKQLSTNEAERDRIRTEMATATQEKEDATRELEESSQQLDSSHKELDEARSASAAAVRSPPAVASPAPSMSSNPFFKRTADAVLSPPMGSPDPTEQHSAFDSIFGPSYGVTSTAPAPTTSFKSETPTQSRGVSGVFDPAHVESPISSAPGDQDEPPAPPKSRQMTSASLPFRAPLTRGDSVSSSVRVAPPASRLSPAGTPRVMTPTASTASPDEHEGAQDPFGTETPTKAPAGDSFFDKREAEPTGESQSNEPLATPAPDSVPGAFPAEIPRAEAAAPSSVPPAALALGTGAVALAAGAGLAAAVTNNEGQEKEAEDSMVAPQPEPKTNFDDVFGGSAHERSKSEQAADFDSAFENMKKEPSTNGAQPGHDEFPDIQELDDDDSTDYSEETPAGFEDDFDGKPPAVPPKEPVDMPSAKNIEPDAAQASPGHLAPPRPPYETASSTASSLPDIESQTSPPTYRDSVPTDDPNHFPPEFTGLLPAREDPTSPPPLAGGTTHTPEQPAGSPPTYGPEVSTPRSASINKPIEAPTKSSPFDFDSAFAGMGAAQVEDDDDDEEEHPFTANRNHAPEFNPTFDTPSQSRSTTAASNAAPASMSVYSAVTNGAPPSSTSRSAAAGAGNNFDDFDNAFSATSAAPAPSQQLNATSTSTSHDWDSMFASLDAPPPSNELNLQRQTTQIGGDAAAATTVARVEPSPPSGTTPEPTAATPFASGQPFEPTPQQTPTQFGSAAATTKPSRPQPGRALSHGTEHDDPILKRLTAMGWSRDDSLKALEQFDYNIDKVRFFLFSSPLPPCMTAGVCDPLIPARVN